MSLGFIAAIIIAAIVNVAAQLLMPRPRQGRPDSMTEAMENPTADAGKPVPVIFGDFEVRSPNVIGFYDKKMDTYDVDS